MSLISPSRLNLFASQRPPERIIDSQFSSLFFQRLPVEIRLIIYEFTIGPTKTRSLYISRDVWSFDDPGVKRTFLGPLLTCGRMYDEVSQILFDRHGVQFYTAQWSLERPIGTLRDCTNVFQRAKRMRLTLFVTGSLPPDNVLLALLAWLKAVLVEREQPLKLLTLQFCAMSPQLRCKPTALLYAAQGFRELCETKFLFQCGFTGGASENAMAALMQHPNVKMPKAADPVSQADALDHYLKAWRASRPGGSASSQKTSGHWLTAGRQVWKTFSNRYFKTTFEL